MQILVKRDRNSSDAGAGGARGAEAGDRRVRSDVRGVRDESSAAPTCILIRCRGRPRWSSMVRQMRTRVRVAPRLQNVFAALVPHNQRHEWQRDVSRRAVSLEPRVDNSEYVQETECVHSACMLPRAVAAASLSGDMTSPGETSPTHSTKNKDFAQQRCVFALACASFSS